MRTVGEMLLTTLIHSNLPRRAWGWAALQAAEVLNRTSDSRVINQQANARANFSRLEKWKGRELPTQTRGLFPFGCLALKHVPHKLRDKLDAHATPMVFLGIDSPSRAFLLGSLYELATSVSVEVTFVEQKFPFREHLKREQYAPLEFASAAGANDEALPSGFAMPVGTESMPSAPVLPAPVVFAPSVLPVPVAPPVVDVVREWSKPQDLWRQALQANRVGTFVIPDQARKKSQASMPNSAP